MSTFLNLIIAACIFLLTLWLDNHDYIPSFGLWFIAGVIVGKVTLIVSEIYWNQKIMDNVDKKRQELEDEEDDQD